MRFVDVEVHRVAGGSVVQQRLGEVVRRVKAYGASAECVEVDGVGSGTGSEAAFETWRRRILEEVGESEQLKLVAGVERRGCIRGVLRGGR